MTAALIDRAAVAIPAARPPTALEARIAASSVQVPVANLIPGKPLPFSLHHRIDGEEILFRGEGKAIDEAERDGLLRNHVTHLSMPREALPRYRAYLDEGLKELVASSQLPAERKVDIFYSVARGIASEVMAAPDRPESIASASEVVSSALVLLEGGREVLHLFMRLVAGEHDLVAHSVNATGYGLALARAVGFRSREPLMEIGLGLLLHDVGLRLVPERILRKRAPLSFEERCVLRRHPQLGVELFLPRDILPRASLAVIRDHHERCDGSGYPAGLVAHQLSPAARIAQIASAFDTLTTRTPAGRGVSTYEALRSMSRGQRAAFDRGLLRRFIEIIGPGERSTPFASP